ncbi:kunitz-type serine protease inhibitor 2 [Musca autumnalis]|uniref:kunitz-type serine protease inhibitor 2 n=1 Tax=Musca autumnalis TaxID=221902 RepID=UPI003CF173E2
MRFLTVCCFLFAVIGLIEARSRRFVDICDRQPTITGLCLTSTLGIYYDAETQHCRYVGCSPNKRFFATLEECEKTCNSKRRRDRRNRHSKNQI